MNNNRVIILMMDSLGVGAAADADKFGDVGADTFGHIYEYAAANKINTNNRHGALRAPNLEKKGFFRAAEKSRGEPLFGYKESNLIIDAAYGYAIESSSGKDTTSGHWEIAGCPILFDWTYFTPNPGGSCFPSDFMTRFIEESKLTDGILDAGHASGTEVINRLGDEHRKTNKPIIYTSADSVFQIAIHEETFGLDRLYNICKIARKILDDMGLNIGRVIARPFVGEKNGNYVRTGNRHDYSVLPPSETLLDKVINENGKVISIGKIADIFANQGISKSVHATGLNELFDKTIYEASIADPGSVVFTNFVDFDSEYGHRRNVLGYAEAIEYFDSRLPELNKNLQENDMVVICADHGCDPTWSGSDHTREHIPFIYWGPKIKPGFIGARETFSDIGQTIADFLELKPLPHGVSSLNLTMGKN